MDLQALQAFLDYNAIPKIKKRPKTFLGIAKQPHYENVMSNIYAFYFNVNEVHGMSDLFINSLLEIILESKIGQEKTVNEISDFTVETEVYTAKNGRIDILLSNENHAIIIENKVYHTLNNDLQDYFKSTKVNENKVENKIGIVLSLNRMNPNHECFINITHVDLLKRVIANLGNYIMDAKEKYVVFLKDFYQNSINLSISEMDSKELKFYFDNQPKIIAAKDFHFAVRTHIATQVELAGELIDEDLKIIKSKGEGNKRLRYYLSPRNKDLMITVLYEGLLTPEKSIFIIVELKNNLLKNKEIYKSITFTEWEQIYLNSYFYSDKNSGWCHFAVKKYFLDEEQIINLAKFIVEKTTQDGLLSVYQKLNSFIGKSDN